MGHQDTGVRIGEAEDDLAARAGDDAAQLLAVRRAALTLYYQAAEHCDDSYGALGDVANQAIAAYARADWRASGIAPEVFWPDLLQWCVMASWSTLDAMVGAAIKRHRTDIAVKVLNVANVPGRHRERVRQHRAELTIWPSVDPGVYVPVRIPAFRYAPAVATMHRARLDALVEEATVDSNGEDQQIMGSTCTPGSSAANAPTSSSPSKRRHAPLNVAALSVRHSLLWRIRMSEYQYYEFLAVDRALDAHQLDEVRAMSTRAHVTPTSFVNTYHWGDFRGDPRRMVERYFDAFLYLANWGTRRLMIRLPARLLDPITAQQYCTTDSATAWAKDGNVIIELTRQSGEGDWIEEDGEGRLASIISARADLAAGDLRLLYLAWLHSVGAGELDDEQVEPPVPANLATLSAPLRSLVDFICLDEDLLAVAAHNSARHDNTAPTQVELASWVRNLPAEEKNTLILRVLDGDDAHLRTELLRRVRGQSATHPPAQTGRTVADLLGAAEHHREDRERRTAKELERQRIRREREAATARDRHLDALAREGEQAWQRVNTFIDTKKTREYDTAVELLRDLRDLSRRDGDPDTFHKRLHLLRQQYAGRPGLLQRLDHARLTHT